MHTRNIGLFFISVYAIKYETIKLSKNVHPFNTEDIEQEFLLGLLFFVESSFR